MKKTRKSRCHGAVMNWFAAFIIIKSSETVQWPGNSICFLRLLLRALVNLPINQLKNYGTLPSAAAIYTAHIHNGRCARCRWGFRFNFIFHSMASQAASACESCSCASTALTSAPSRRIYWLLFSLFLFSMRQFRPQRNLTPTPKSSSLTQDELHLKGTGKF